MCRESRTTKNHTTMYITGTIRTTETRYDSTTLKGIYVTGTSLTLEEMKNHTCISCEDVRINPKNYRDDDTTRRDFVIKTLEDNGFVVTFSKDFCPTRTGGYRYWHILIYIPIPEAEVKRSQTGAAQRKLREVRKLYNRSALAALGL